MAYHFAADRFARQMQFWANAYGCRVGGQKLGISHGALNRYEHGELPSISNLLKICSGMNVPPQVFFEKTD